MALVCNIDEQGQRARRIWGWGCLLAALGCVAAGWWLWWLWIVAGVLGGFGVLGLYEARKKWCVMRAMGFKTPL